MSSASNTQPEPGKPESSDDRYDAWLDEPEPSEPRWVTGRDPRTPELSRATYVRHYRWLLSQAVPVGSHAIGYVPSGMVADVERILNHLGYHTLRLLPNFESNMTRMVAWMPMPMKQHG